MLTSRLRSRYRYIMGYFIRVILGTIFWELVLPRFGLRRIVQQTRSNRLRGMASRYRNLAIRLGGLMIKLGQFMSSRLDVLPPEITDELSGLQDEVPAENINAIQALAETELGKPLDEVFDYFDSNPLAAASLGQVHRARLRGELVQDHEFIDVVVKVQRPFISELIKIDFEALRLVGRWLMLYEPIRKRVAVPALIDELEATVQREIDYIAEGANADKFGANFSRRAQVHVPRVVWSCTTRRVLTLEDVFAIKITDYPAITSAGIDRREVAHLLLETYLKQIFEDGFFHADPHPGNLFVNPARLTKGKNKRWRLTFVDFGMVGIVPENLKDGLRELLIGIGTRDSNRVVKSYQTLGILLPSADIPSIVEAEERLFERFWGMSMRELRNMDRQEMKQFAHQFRAVMYSMPFQVPHDLILLGRTVAILSGMCTGLDPEFNLWTQVTPYAQKLLTDSNTANWEVWLDEIGELFKELISLPGHTNRVFSLLERGEITIRLPRIEGQLNQLEKAVNNLTGVMIFTVFLIGGVLLLDNGERSLGYLSWGCAFITLILTFIFSSRRGPPA